MAVDSPPKRPVMRMSFRVMTSSRGVHSRYSPNKADNTTTIIYSLAFSFAEFISFTTGNNK